MGARQGVGAAAHTQLARGMRLAAWRAIAGKVASVLREFGVTVGLLYLLDRALRTLPGGCALHVYEFMVQRVDDGLRLLPERFSRHIVLREMARGDATLDRLPARPEIKAARFAQGAWCVGVERKGELLGCMWLIAGTYAEDEVRCDYRLPAAPAGQAADCVFDFDLYLFPEHRMGTGFAALWQAAGSHLQARGVQRSYSRMTRFNLASRRAHLRLGSEVVGRAAFLRLGRLEFMLSSLRPFAAVTWSRRVELRLPRAARAGGSERP